MNTKHLTLLMILPVVLIAWLTFRVEPVVGLPLHQVVMYTAPEETVELQDATAGDLDSASNANWSQP